MRIITAAFFSVLLLTACVACSGGGVDEQLAPTAGARAPTPTPTPTATPIASLTDRLLRVFSFEIGSDLRGEAAIKDLRDKIAAVDPAGLRVWDPITLEVCAKVHAGQSAYIPEEGPPDLDLWIQVYGPRDEFKICQWRIAAHLKRVLEPVALSQCDLKIQWSLLKPEGTRDELTEAEYADQIGLTQEEINTTPGCGATSTSTGS